MSTPKKVLLVEDEFILYDDVAEFLEKAGFKIAGNNGSNKAIDSYDKALEVLHAEIPDFAILDIQIKGDKDGLELGAYIKQHFKIPIIFLTAYNNYENLERAKNLADAFVIKLNKPLNKEQLWADIVLLMPKIERKIWQRKEGKFMKVKEIDTSALQKLKSNHQPADSIELETFIKWNEITLIISSKNLAHNTILLYTTNSKGYFYRGSLNEIELMLPDYFQRFNQSAIVNLLAITAKGKLSGVYYIGDTRIEISDTYRDEASSKIHLYLGDKF